MSSNSSAEKMTGTLKDGLLLGGRIHYVTVHKQVPGYIV